MPDYNEAEVELARQTRRVIADATTKKQHPSFITKAIGNDHLSRMRGAFEFCYATGIPVPDHVEARRREAVDAAATWL